MGSVNAKVTIYSDEYNPFFERIKSLLNKKKALFDVISVEGRHDLWELVTFASGQKTMPQVFINGQSVGGYTDIMTLDRTGVLDRLLSEAPSAEAPALPT